MEVGILAIPEQRTSKKIWKPSGFRLGTSHGLVRLSVFWKLRKRRNKISGVRGGKHTPGSFMPPGALSRIISPPESQTSMDKYFCWGSSWHRGPWVTPLASWFGDIVSPPGVDGIFLVQCWLKEKEEEKLYSNSRAAVKPEFAAPAAVW